ncbi:HAD-IIIA family hydrolase [candidate division KSB1 bacterium]|nr:HAD-IIIA family hydrolase [candidate division KSB1 bacterium]
MIKDKIQSRDELAELSQDWRESGQTIGFTSGAFDLLHTGHVEFLEKSKSHCDILIVGINSDSSIRRYKGNHRPIVPQEQRARLVAALEMVNYVFVFNERRNKANIEALKPHLYIKAGDYSRDQLTSGNLVESYGGKILLIPIESSLSSSDLINKIQSSHGQTNDVIIEYERAAYFPVSQSKLQPAVFLDRDGTINVDDEYLHEPEKLQLLPNALPGLKNLQNMGFKLVIITTQAGIGLGYFTKEDFYKVNRMMFGLLKEENILIDKIYFCPHSITENCGCRKPGTKLIDRAIEDLNINTVNSYMIGDKTCDILAGKNAGLCTILVETGNAGKDGEFDIDPDFIAIDLLAASKWILERERL